jgi:ABC-type multidrug transport system fused ATPase/permease subunit
VNLKQVVTLYRHAYQSLTQKGRKLLKTYLLTLILLAGIDAIALVLISASLFKSVALSRVLGTFLVEPEIAFGFAALLFVLRSSAAAAMSFILAKRLTAEQVRVGQVNYQWINSMPWSIRKNFSQGDTYIAIDHAPRDLFQRFLIPSIEIFAEAFSVLMIVLVLSVVQTQTALVAVCYFGLVAIIQNRILSEKIHRSGKIHVESLTAVTNLISEIQALSKLTKVIGSETLETELEARRTKRVSSTQHLAFLEQLPRNLMEVTLISGVAVIIVSTLAFSGSDMVLGALTLFAAAAFRLLPGFNRIQSNSLMVLSAMPMAKRSLIGFQNKDELGGTEAIETSPVLERTNSINFLNGSRVEFENVSYTYPNSDIPVVHNLSFTFDAGNQYAVVGESGSGKTTIVDLMLGLLKPDSGTLRVFGGNSAILGYVPQTTHIFDGSFAQNIALEWIDEAIDFGKVEKAIKAAALENVINGNPNQAILENTLSGGQMQRIGIARALYRNPNLLVLDEATNSLDVNTENEVIESLQSIRGQVTTVLIAHSMRTVQKVDKVLYVENGRVVGFENFKVLMSKSQKFNDLVESGKLFIDED